MDRKIRVGAVSYLNTKPLLYGIERSAVMEQIELRIDYPSRIATLLLEDEIDMGLVPVAILPKMDVWHINGDCCIGCDGPVASVCLFSETPVEKVERVLMDYQSRTSVQLARILLRDYWKIKPELVEAGKDFRQEIKGTTAGIVIGDRALEQRRISSHVYDLGEAWKDMTGLPFVFAAWISNKPLDAGFIREFNEANKIGLQQIDAIVAQNPYNEFDLHQYYTRYLDYHLDDTKREGLKRFLSYLQRLESKNIYIAS